MDVRKCQSLNRCFPIARKKEHRCSFFPAKIFNSGFSVVRLLVVPLVILVILGVAAGTILCAVLRIVLAVIVLILLFLILIILAVLVVIVFRHLPYLLIVLMLQQ